MSINVFFRPGAAFAPVLVLAVAVVVALNLWRKPSVEPSHGIHKESAAVVNETQANKHAKGILTCAPTIIAGDAIKYIEKYTVLREFSQNKESEETRISLTGTYQRLGQALHAVEVLSPCFGLKYIYFKKTNDGTLQLDATFSRAEKKRFQLFNLDVGDKQNNPFELRPLAGSVRQLVSPPPERLQVPQISTPSPDVRYLGSFAAPSGALTLYLAQHDDELEAKVGESLPNGYIIESATAQAISLVYPPTGTKVIVPVAPEQ
jgi:hypothetical protein